MGTRAQARAQALASAQHEAWLRTKGEAVLSELEGLRRSANEREATLRQRNLELARYQRLTFQNYARRQRGVELEQVEDAPSAMQQRQQEQQQPAEQLHHAQEQLEASERERRMAEEFERHGQLQQEQHARVSISAEATDAHPRSSHVRRCRT